MTRLVVLALVVLTGLGDAAPAQRGRGEPPITAGDDALRCTALANLDLFNLPDAPTRILSARLVDVPANGLEWFPRGISIPTPIKQYCLVTGYVAPQNKFEMRLPLPSDWNQKFFFTACAGFCGYLSGEACNPALGRGYASVTANGGHDSGPGFDGLWAAYAPRLQEDYGWRSTHIVTIAAKTITTQYYGRAIAHSYISGCSKGGHAVLKEAQQFPEDYDGYLPSAPVYDLTGRAIASAWEAQAVSDGRGGSVLNAAAADAVHKSVLGRCGAQAGVDEGLVTDPLACDWRPEMIKCASAATSPDCLTERQIDAIKRLMSPVVNSKREVIYAYPYLPGTETGWTFNYYPVNNGRFGYYFMGDGFLRFMANVTPRKNFDLFKFDFDRDPATLDRARSIYDATSYDLRALKARGGKILMWHGWADGGIMATSSIGYYEGVMKVMGGRQKTEDFFRLFLIPGTHHCGGGPGFNEFDALTLLENWVEKDQAPDVLIANRRQTFSSPDVSTNDVIERSRPVYPYPIRARYSSGDPKQAISFVPVDPSVR